MSETAWLDQLPHRFADRTEIAVVRAAHGELAAGDGEGVRYRLAGRAMGRRGMGKAAFLDLEDRCGRIQLLASVDGLGEEPSPRLRHAARRHRRRRGRGDRAAAAAS